jgi:WD40 repeat protein
MRTGVVVAAVLGTLAAAAEPPRLDRYGDALPDGVVVRLGTKRFGHSWWTESVVWSPDGKVIASAGGYTNARRVCLWDAATGKELHDLPARGAVRSIAFSPAGKTLAAAEGDRGVVLWDVASGKEVGRFAEPGGGRVVAFAPDGKTLATAGPGGIIHVREVATGRPVVELKGKAQALWNMVYAPDGKSLVTAGVGGDLVVWDLATGVVRWQNIPHGTGVSGLSFSPDGKALATSGDDGPVRIWDSVSGKNLLSLGRETREGTPSVAFSPDGRTLAAPGPAGTVSLWDPNTGQVLRHWKSGEFQVGTVAFSPDGRTLATGARNGSRVRLWDVATGGELRPAVGHNATVRGLCFGPDGKTLLSVGTDRAAYLWDVRSGEGKRLEGVSLEDCFLPDHPAANAFGPDGRGFAVGTDDGQVRLWDGDGRVRGTLPGHGGHGGHVDDVAFSPDGKVLASSGGDSVVRFWDMATLRELPREEKGVGTRGALVYSPDGRKLAATRGPGSWPVVLDAQTGKVLSRLAPGPRATKVAFSPDGKFLATIGVSVEKAVRIWDAATGRLVGRCEGVEGAPGWNCLAFSPDGWLLAAGRSERADTISLWDLTTFQEAACLRGHHSGVSALAFSRDGRLLASGGGDATILVWDLTGSTAADNRVAETLSPSRLEECWKALAGTDTPAAYRAVRALAADPGRSVPFLATRLQAPAPPYPAEVSRLVADLDADSFEVWARAEEELTKLGEAIRPALRKVLAGSPAPEVRRRVERVLDQPVTPPDWPRQRRALAVLEYAGTPEARRHLQALAGAKVESRLADEARAALARCNGATSLER